MIVAIRGYENKQNREWERARIIAYQVYVGIPKKGNNKPIQAYMPLPSDINKVKKMSEEEKQAQRDIFIKKAMEMNKKNLN